MSWPLGNKSGEVYVFPSGDTAGVTDRAYIQSLVNSGQKVVIKAGAPVYFDRPLVLQNNSTVIFENGATITRRNSFTVNCTTTQGSTTVSYTGNHPEILQYNQVVGSGIPLGNRVETVSAGAFSISQAATASATVSITFYMGDNLIYANQKSGISLVCLGGWGYVAGNIGNQDINIKAYNDANGSGIRLEACTLLQIDGIWSKDNQYHGMFLTSDQTINVAGQAQIFIGRYAASGNGVRGLHARASGTSTVWPGMNDVRIESLYLSNNGQVCFNCNASYDLTNGGLFFFVGGMRRVDIGSCIVVNDLGVGFEMYGDDNTTDPGIYSQYNHVGSLVLHNCGQAAQINNGCQSASFDSIMISCDRLYASTGLSTDTTTLNESVKSDFSFAQVNYTSVGTITLPASWTAAQIAQINVGDMIQSSVSGTGMDVQGCAVVSINAAARTAVVYCIVDPLGLFSDQASGLVTSVTPSAGSITLNGAQTSGGVSNYSLPRKIQIISSGNDSGSNFTIVGTDCNGAAYTETVQGPNAGTTNSVRMFKTVTSITVDVTCLAAVTIGTCLARPYNITASAQPAAWRGTRSSGLTFNNNVSTSVVGDIKHIKIGRCHVEGVGSYGVIMFATPLLGAGVKTYRDITIDMLTLVECQIGGVINSAEDFHVSKWSTENCGRGIGGDGADHIEFKNSSGCSIAAMSMRFNTSAYTFGGLCVHVDSDSNNITIGGGGAVLLQTTGTPYAQFSGINCEIISPKRSDTYAPLTVLAGNITGSGLPVIRGDRLETTVAAGSSVPLTTNTPANIGSVALTAAGRYEVTTQVDFSLTATTVTSLNTGPSLTSATLPAQPGGTVGNASIAPDALSTQSLALVASTGTYSVSGKPTTVIVSSSPVTLYLVSQATFSAGSVSGYGTISARWIGP